MDKPKRALTECRLKRRELWLSLWLARVLSFLAAFSGAPMPRPWKDWFNRTLNTLARCMASIILIRTAQRRMRRGEFPPVRDPRQVLVIDRRALIGARLRRALKARTISERVEKMRRVLDNLDAVIAMLSRRLRRGLSRYVSARSRVLPLHPPAGGPPPQGKLGEELRATDTS